MEIPKIINYCWYGKRKKPKLVRDCIKSWKKYLPDYQIIEWNEKNTDLTHPFVKEAYQKKKWAFVSDYVRLKKLYEFGGIYLDTDMMVIKNFNALLRDTCFFGAESLNFINAGIIGAIPKNSFIKTCRDVYNTLSLEGINHFGDISIPQIITQKFKELYNFEKDFGSLVVQNGIKIYPASYFYALPYENRGDLNHYKKYITKESYAIHLWNASWVEYSEFHYLRTGQYIKGFSKMMKIVYKSKELKYAYFRKIGSCIKESLKWKS